jgi:hypothetical protein
VLFFFLKEVAIVEPDGEREKIRRIALRVRETETPGRRGAAFCYARAAYAAFREISELRGEGFSMAAICKVMENDGLLPKGASRHSFRRAFRKELARRGRAAKAERGEHPAANAAGKKEPRAPARKPAAADKPENPVSGAEDEKLKELTGNVVDTGTGVIRKLPNGSFDF